MSYLLGNPAHRCYVYPDFDKALQKFVAAGIGPFFVLDDVGVICHYRGEQHPFKVQVAFAYSGNSCIEISTPLKNAGISAFYHEFLGRNPHGALHHIAYYSHDFDATLAKMEKAGKPPRTVLNSRDSASGRQVEIFCEPVGVEDPSAAAVTYFDQERESRDQPQGEAEGYHEGRDRRRQDRQGRAPAQLQDEVGPGAHGGRRDR
jgi:hypothetical protein